MTANEQLPRIVIFVSGERSCVENAIYNARQLYLHHPFVFICEPSHCEWLSRASSDNVFIVDQPFNPFGSTASKLRQNLEAFPIEACALVIAGLGFESFRFRIFALGLPTTRFVLLRGTSPGSAKHVSRFSFGLLASVTLLWSGLRKIGRGARAGLHSVSFVRKLQHRISLSETLSVAKDKWLSDAVDAQRMDAIAKTRTGRFNHKSQSAKTYLAIKYLDRDYRRVFRDLLSQPWSRWFDLDFVSRGYITIVIGSVGPGGSERQAVTTLLGLVSRGYSDLSLLCTRLNSQVDRFYAHLLEGSPILISEVSEGFDSASNSGDGLEERISNGLKLLFERLPGELRDITWYARDFLRRKPEIVHTWLDYTNAKAGIAAAIVGIPRIIISTRSVTPDHFAFFQPYMREAYRALAARPGVCLLNNSEAGARNYEKWLGLRRGTFKIVRNGFDFSELNAEQKAEPARDFRARLGLPTDVPVVSSVMRFSEEKRPLFWIDVAARVAEHRPDVMFLLLGDGPLWAEAHRHAAALGLADRILMPGYDKQSSVAIAASDVLLLTSSVEGLPNVLIEAQALGVPVVTTKVGGAAETLLQDRTGYAVSDPSTELVANAVLRILGDASWRNSAKLAAQQFVRETFSISRMLDRTLDAYFGRGEFGKC